MSSDQTNPKSDLISTKKDKSVRVFLTPDQFALIEKWSTRQAISMAAALRMLTLRSIRGGSGE